MMWIKKCFVCLFEKLYSKNTFLMQKLFFRVRIMSSKRTINYIINSDCSVSRFGDGELDLILKSESIGFQNSSRELSDQLEIVLKNKNHLLLKCIPKSITSSFGLNKNAKSFWKDWKSSGHYEKVAVYLKEMCGKHYCFGDTQISRPYMDYSDAKRANMIFNLLKKIWYKKDLLIVEGIHTKLGVGNDLFDDASSIKRIIVPAINAFDFYNQILFSIKSHCENRLILLAVGPTATILASALCDLGIRAIDIGHIDIEYEWFLMGAREKVAIKGKYTNEATNGKNVVFVSSNNEYLSQIVERIGIN